MNLKLYIFSLLVFSGVCWWAVKSSWEETSVYRTSRPDIYTIGKTGSVPHSAVCKDRDDGRTFVWVENDCKAVKKYVELSECTPDSATLISSGLNRGERILVFHGREERQNK